MDWNAESNDDRQAMRRIVALFVALAALADCACSRSLVVRCLVLSILRPAEVFARDIAIRQAQACGVPAVFLPTPPDGGGSVGDAMQLASCFRALAIALANLWAQALRSVRRCSHHDFLFSHSSGSHPAHTAHQLPRRGAGLASGRWTRRTGGGGNLTRLQRDNLPFFAIYRRHLVDGLAEQCLRHW